MHSVSLPSPGPTLNSRQRDGLWEREAGSVWCGGREGWGGGGEVAEMLQAESERAFVTRAVLRTA